MTDEELNKVTEGIIGCAFAVSNELGSGFLERVYENAMFIELRERGFEVASQRPLTVYYQKIPVGEYYADLVVNEEIIVELKAAKNLAQPHFAQILNYLRACNKRCGLLLNFGNPRVEVQRVLNGFME